MSKKKKNRIEEIELKLPTWQIQILATRAKNINLSFNDYITYILVRYMDDQVNGAPK